MHSNQKMAPDDLFYYNFHRLMDEQGLSGSRLADQMGTTRSSISVYSTGKRFPGPEKLREFSDFFHVPVSDFFKTPEELKLERVLPSSKSSSSLVGNTISASELADQIHKHIQSGASKTFYISVSSDKLSPYAAKDDLLECTVPSSISDGRMVLVAQESKLAMYRSYRSGSGYMLISEKNATSPLHVFPGDNSGVQILAVVISCKHTF